MSKIEEYIKNEMNKISDNEMFFSLDLPDDNFQLLELKKFFGDTIDKSILDLGCGKGRFLKHFVKHCSSATGIDISDKLIDHARKNVPDADFVVGSATKLPFDNESFDLVYSIETFEHIPDIESAISEIHRVLKPGGKVVIIDKSLYSIHPIFSVPTFLRKWILERRGKWIYSKNDDIDFKEKYFTLRELDKIFEKYFKNGSSSKISSYGIGQKTEKLIQKYPILKIKFYLTDLVYKYLPFTRFFIVWRWSK